MQFSFKTSGRTWSDDLDGHAALAPLNDTPDAIRNALRSSVRYAFEALDVDGNDFNDEVLEASIKLGPESVAVSVAVAK